MSSEFEEYRRKRLFDDLVDIELTESDDDDIVCAECGSVFFKLNLDLGVVCADPECKAVVDLTSIEVD